MIKTYIYFVIKHKTKRKMSLDENIFACFAQRPYYLGSFFWLVYDSEGSQYFEELTKQEEYYLTRTECHILQMNASEIISQAAMTKDRRVRLVELGAGTAVKTSILLAATLKYQGAPVDYRPIDISETALDEAQVTLQNFVPDVRITSQVSNFLTDGLELPKFDGCTLIVYIGSTIGNFTPDEAQNILHHVREQLQPGDALLLGVDMKKDPNIIVRAYDDAGGINNSFNLHLLRRLNKDFGYNFNLEQFRYLTVWNEAESRREAHIESLCSQQVQCKHFPDKSIEFEKGERINIASSYKYTKERIQTLLSNAGFHFENVWNDEKNWYSVVLARIPDK